MARPNCIDWVNMLFKGWNPLAARRPWACPGVSGGQNHPQRGADPGGRASDRPQRHAAQLRGRGHLPARGSGQGPLLLWQQVRSAALNPALYPSYVFRCCCFFLSIFFVLTRGGFLSMQFPPRASGADLRRHHGEEGHQALSDHEWDCLWEDNGARWEEPGELEVLSKDQVLWKRNGRQKFLNNLIFLILFILLIYFERVNNNKKLKIQKTKKIERKKRSRRETTMFLMFERG